MLQESLKEIVNAGDFPTINANALIPFFSNGNDSSSYTVNTDQNQNDFKKIFDEQTLKDLQLYVDNEIQTTEIFFGKILTVP